MEKTKCVIRYRDFIPAFCKISGIPEIDVYWAFDRSEILGELCVVEAELTKLQLDSLDKAAIARRNPAA